ncbi:hypothetical protein [Paenibacillus marinisediminis]
MNYNEILLQLGADYLQDSMPADLVCAFAGGSVGRGEADEYSDLDLIYYVLESNRSDSTNIIYNNQAIQLDIHTMPQRSDIEQNPWDYRFMLEAKVIYDPAGKFEQLREEAISYLNSCEGRQLILKQASEVVQSRIQWLHHSIQDEQWITAGLAAHSAVIDAAFAYAYFTAGEVSTGGLLKCLSALDSLELLKQLVFLGCSQPSEIDRWLEALSMYSTHVRDQYGTNFALDSIQDSLVRRKVARFIQNGDWHNIHWQIAGEAFWCYLSIAKEGMTLEQHIQQLPASIQAAMNDLGFKPRSVEQLAQLESAAVSILKEIKMV